MSSTLTTQNNMDKDFYNNPQKDLFKDTNNTQGRKFLKRTSQNPLMDLEKELLKLDIL